MPPTSELQKPGALKPGAARPFLKWAGGKSAIVKDIAGNVPPTFKKYFEPFLGSGAVFFFLTSRFPKLKAILNDINPQLIETYTAVQSSPKEVVEELKQLREQHSADHFKEVRSKLMHFKNPAELAAAFIYLNKTCYNGLYRVNSRGQFNVPMGKYDNPQIFDEENLIAVSRALNKADLLNVGYRKACKDADEGDFVYFDPPYDPISKTASFTGYTKDGFFGTEQEDLAEFCKELHRRKCFFLLSNSNTGTVEALYKGFRVQTLNVRRYISCNGAGRRTVSEVLVMNYDANFRLLRLPR